jgi:hypothetical protein
MIAKTINSMLEKTKSLKLKKKPKLLAGAYRARTGILSDETTTTSSTRSALKCLLWMSLQRGVFDPGAARRLSRLRAFRQEDGPLYHAESESNLFFPLDNLDSDPMIDFPDETSFEFEDYPTKPTDEDPCDDLLFSELGLYEDEEAYSSNIFNNNPQPQPGDINNDLFSSAESPHTPLSPNEIPCLDTHDAMDCDILDQQTSSQHNNATSPLLPAPLENENDQPVPMDGISSPPLLPITTDQIYPEPTIPDSDMIIPPSSPPPFHTGSGPEDLVPRNDDDIYKNSSDDMLPQ